MEYQYSRIHVFRLRVMGDVEPSRKLWRLAILNRETKETPMNLQYTVSTVNKLDQNHDERLLITAEASTRSSRRLLTALVAFLTIAGCGNEGASEPLASNSAALVSQPESELQLPPLRRVAPPPGWKSNRTLRQEAGREADRTRPWGGGHVYWTYFANPAASGLSIKDEDLNVMRWASGSVQECDAVYWRGWGCHVAVKVPDDCRYEPYTGNWWCDLLYNRVDFVNPDALGWPSCPL